MTSLEYKENLNLTRMEGRAGAEILVMCQTKRTESCSFALVKLVKFRNAENICPWMDHSDVQFRALQILSEANTCGETVFHLRWK